MEYIQTRQEENANRHRFPTPAYTVDDEVSFNDKNIQTTRLFKKLDWKRFSRFKIKNIISPYMYELDLPVSMKIHPVFHVSKLEPCAIDRLPDYIPPPAPSVIVKGAKEWEVDEILDLRLRYGSLQYLVRWEGYDVPIWQSSENLSNSLALLVRFHRLDANKLNLIGALTEFESKEGATITDRYRHARSRPVPLPRMQLRSKVV